MTLISDVMCSRKWKVRKGVGVSERAEMQQTRGQICIGERRAPVVLCWTGLGGRKNWKAGHTNACSCMPTIAQQRDPDKSAVGFHSEATIA